MRAAGICYRAEYLARSGAKLMANLCIVGLQWGDEGKGKVVDLLSDRFDIVARYQGGSNAGHTVWIGKEKYVLHLLPSGILHEGVDCVIGNGVALDPVLLVEEIDHLRERGVKVENNLFVSDRAHMVMPYHKVFDSLDSSGKRGKFIGTTGRGIGPCYEDKMARIGIRFSELFAPESFKERLRENLEIKNGILTKLYGMDPLDFQEMYNQYMTVAENLKPYVADSTAMLIEAARGGRSILFEGAQGALLDIDFGTYPFVTCSTPGAAGVATGLGLSPKDVNCVLGILKAYTTRVGEGPFPTELRDDAGERLRDRGREFGATTGRPRRCGWFDAVAAKHTCRLNGADTIALTKLDVLSGEDEISICVGYKRKGKVVETFPGDSNILGECEPVYEQVKGWKDDISGARSVEELPVEARKYIEKLESLVEVPIGAISTGPEREQNIFRQGWITDI